MRSSAPDELVWLTYDPVWPGSPGYRPVVGLTTYLEPSVTGDWDRPSMVLPVVYRDAVVEAGGVAVLLPPQPADHHLAHQVLDGVDALVLTGGVDVDPSLYGAQPDPRTDVPRTDRDAWETTLLKAALVDGLPVLAVCRGVQLLNVVLGGTLHQHLPDVVGHTRHSPAPATFGTTSVRVAPGTRLASILGDGEIDVRCHHHQAVDRVGDLVPWGLPMVVCARADDGTVEAVEQPGDDFVVGVQWHTEEDGHDRRLTAALVEAARTRSERKA